MKDLLALPSGGPEVKADGERLVKAMVTAVEKVSTADLGLKPGKCVSTIAESRECLAAD